MARPRPTKVPVQRRIHLTGWKRDGYTVVIKDNLAENVIHSIPAPSYPAGNAIVRALRDLEKAKGTIW